ncbi:MAG TPA: aldose 1-epimerase [Deinococcales bacterium]|nr:aldose 1-epimerase [Deinococcales bacterium]
MNALPLQVLRNDTWVLAVDPNTGASPTSLDAIIGGQRVPVMRRTPPDVLGGGKSTYYSSFTLAPYSNRIRAARFTFRGQEHVLRPTTPEGTAQHGDVRNRPWPLARTESSLIGSLDSRDFEDGNFPFPYVVTVEYHLNGNALTTALQLDNVGDKPMPAGGGFHPYFARTFGNSVDARLQFNAQGVYFTGPDVMPTEGQQPIPDELNFGQTRRIGKDRFDHAFGGWDGRAVLSWGDGPYRLVMTATREFSHLIVFTAPDGSIAIEPVTHATDAINLAERGVQNTGLIVLDPGERLRAEITYRLEREG